jgi:hypothetical protein
MDVQEKPPQTQEERKAELLAKIHSREMERKLENVGFSFSDLSSSNPYLGCTGGKEAILERNPKENGGECENVFRKVEQFKGGYTGGYR